MRPTRLVPFTLELEAPAVLTAPGGNPDSARSLEFIPGSVLRGAVARGLGDPGADPAEQERFRRLVLAGRVRYLNAYPVAQERRAVPVPLSWRREKHGDGTFDLAADLADGSGTGDAPWAEETLVPVAEPFVALGAAEERAVPVRMRAAVHHQRSRRMGRPVEGEGALFVFEAVDEGQSFRGFLAVEGDDDQTDTLVDEVRQALGDRLLLGRSRRAGYGGRAAITWGAARDRELEGRKDLLTQDLAAGDLVRILFLSDALLRNPATGAYDPGAVESILPESLGGRIEIVSRHWAFRLAGGFNRTWGLELPQGLALRAGSVLVAQSREPIPLADLLSLEAVGLGERRAEGFGRLAFLEPPVERPGLLPPAAPPRPDEPQALSPTVERMERRLVQDALEHHLATVAARRLAKPRSLPSPSLLARLRGPLRTGPAGVETLRRWLGSGDGEGALRSKATGDLKGARITDWNDGPIPLDEWLRETLDSGADQLAQVLQLEGLAHRHFLTSEAQALEVLRSPEVLEDARWRLVDRVLALAARKATRDRDGRKNHGT